MDYMKLQQAIDLNSAAYHAAITLSEALADVDRVAGLLAHDRPHTFNGSRNMLEHAQERAKQLLKEATEGT